MTDKTKRSGRTRKLGLGKETLRTLRPANRSARALKGGAALRATAPYQAAEEITGNKLLTLFGYTKR